VLLIGYQSTGLQPRLLSISINGLGRNINPPRIKPADGTKAVGMQMGMMGQGSSPAGWST